MTECDQPRLDQPGLYDPRDERDSCGFGLLAQLDDGASRLDGMHFEVGAATTIAERFVGPRLVNVAVGAAGSTG